MLSIQIITILVAASFVQAMPFFWRSSAKRHEYIPPTAPILAPTGVFPTGSFPTGSGIAFPTGTGVAFPTGTGGASSSGLPSPLEDRDFNWHPAHPMPARV